MSDKLPPWLWMVDSGAYTVWKSGGKIDLDDYCRYLDANRKSIWQAVALDVIPGRPDRKPCPAEIDDAAERGFDNWVTMRKRGLNPIPVYHQGEHPEWLDVYLAGTNYIGLSPSSNYGRPETRKWLDECFDRIPKDTSGKPIVKTHGFGMTTPEFIARYNWYSYDSATWILQGQKFGRILVPRRTADGQWNFLEPRSIVISTRDRIDPAPNVFDILEPDIQAEIKTYVEEECGFGFDTARRRPKTRAALNLLFFQRVEALGTGKFVLATAPYVPVTAMTVIGRHQQYRLVSFANPDIQRIAANL